MKKNGDGDNATGDSNIMILFIILKHVWTRNVYFKARYSMLYQRIVVSNEALL